MENSLVPPVVPGPPAAAWRIVSLIPSATEIVDLLGLSACLVGRSHECDYPISIQNRPICTEPKFNPEGNSTEIHDRVTELLQTAMSVYRLKLEVLETLQPTHILTQAQCEVCAVSLAEVEAAMTELTGLQPQILSLQPNVLSDVWQDIEQVAQAFGSQADRAIGPLKDRVEQCQTLAQTDTATLPTVACIEWIDPLMAAGNWLPELVTLAGGRSLFGTLGHHSPWLDWKALVEADPDYIILMPCGFGLERTRDEAQILRQKPQWHDLKAVVHNRVYITDGNHYFNRPGPRLVDSLEILTEILHPGQCAFGYRGTGWDVLT